MRAQRAAFSAKCICMCDPHSNPLGGHSHLKRTPAHVGSILGQQRSRDGHVGLVDEYCSARLRTTRFDDALDQYQARLVHADGARWVAAERTSHEGGMPAANREGPARQDVAKDIMLGVVQTMPHRFHAAIGQCELATFDAHAAMEAHARDVHARSAVHHGDEERLRRESRKQHRIGHAEDPHL